MADQPTLFYLTSEMPFPADSGGRIKTFRFLEALSKEYRVRLLCAHGGERISDINALKSTIDLEGVQAFENHLPRTGLNWIRALMTSPSFNAYRIYSKELEHMIKWSVRGADVVIMDHLECIDLIPEDFRGKIIYHSHNAEFHLWEAFSSTLKNPLAKWAVDWETERVKVLERYAIHRTSFTFAAPNDQQTLSKELKISPDKFKNTFHLGNDAMLELPAIDTSKNGNKIFYAGTLSWQPNSDGLTWFVKECWPKILEKKPEAELVVCGKGASKEFSTLLKTTKGISQKGFVADLESEMKISALAIAPLRFGSGMKIKTFDALYRGLPLVCTSLAAEGIEIQHQKHAFIVDSAIDFSNSVVQALSNKESAQTIALEGRKLAQEKYTYAKLFEQMIGDIKALYQSS